MNTAVLTGGAVIGLGIFLCIREIFPAPPSLTAALLRFDPRAPHARIEPADDLGSRVGRWLATQISGTALDVRIPRRDLALLAKTTEGYLVQKLAMLGIGLAAPAVLWTLLLPDAGWILSGGFTIAYAVFMFVVPDIALRSQAREAREEFRTSLIAYLDLVKIARTSGAGPAEAIELPVRICDGWAFQRLAQALDPTVRGTRNTWDELTRLADQIGVTELAEVAAIARRAGSQGAAIVDSLTAKAKSLRDQQLSRALAQAKSRTETMTMPVALSVLGYLILLGYPAYSHIIGG